MRYPDLPFLPATVAAYESYEKTGIWNPPCNLCEAKNPCWVYGAFLKKQAYKLCSKCREEMELGGIKTHQPCQDRKEFSAEELPL